MPRRSPPPLPTDAELDILRVLWTRGPSTVKDVHDVVRRRRDTGYTTVLKLLQIMHGKGLVARDESARTHIYRAAIDRDVTQGRLVDYLATRAFEGSGADLAMRALAKTPATRQELQDIRALIERLEREQR